MYIHSLAKMLVFTMAQYLIKVKKGYVQVKMVINCFAVK